MSVESLMSGLIGALAGGLITGGFSIYAINRTETFAKSSAAENEAGLVRSLLHAIHDELEVVFERYRRHVAPQVEALQPNTPFALFFPVNNDYFTVFNGNAHLVGKIKDHDLRRSLVRTYVLAKGLVDTFRMNNHMLAELERAEELAAATGLESDERVRRERYAALCDYGALIQKDHYEALSAYEDLFRRLHKNGVLSQ